MLSNELEKRLASLISWGTLGITLLVTDRVSMDPVNVGKMVLLSVIAGGGFALCILKYKDFVLSNKLLSVAISIFLLFSLASIFISKSPWEKGFYGTYGRNTGFLTYVSLSILFVAAAQFSSISSFKLVIKSLLIAGFINLAYCLYTLLGKDIFLWSNPYGKILGTFGNPDFISAFLGIFVTALTGLLFSRSVSKTSRFLLVILIFLSIFAIRKSAAIQGLVLCAFGISLVIFFYIRSKFSKNWIQYSYIGTIFIIGTLAMLGVLQKGPLANILYKSSVSYRGEYWQAGINMGVKNPVSGVGLDSYGVFYRAYREASAAISPGVAVVTDTAHNVYIDILAGIGIIGFISYLIIIALVIKSAIKQFRVGKSYDPVFVILIVSWACYQLQSIVSINQIGLAVWGWILGGAIIGYSNMPHNSEQIQKPHQSLKTTQGKRTSKPSLEPISAGLVISLFAGSVAGLIIALPPFIADIKSRPTNSGRTVEQLVAVAKMWPPENIRISRIIISLADSQKYQEAQSLAAEAALKFPKDYVAWFTLYQFALPDTKEKVAYSQRLHELDPYNPEFMPK